MLRPVVCEPIVAALAGLLALSADDVAAVRASLLLSLDVPNKSVRCPGVDVLDVGGGRFRNASEAPLKAASSYDPWAWLLPDAAVFIAEGNY